MYIGKATWKRIWRFPKKLKLELSQNSAISLLGIHPKEVKSRSQKDICIPMFITALFFTIANIQKQPKPPSMDEWIKKTWCVCVCMYVCMYL